MGAARRRARARRDHRLRPGRARRRGVRLAARGRRRVEKGAPSARSSRRSRSRRYTRPWPARSTRSTTTLGDAPERVNEDPYGEGWLCVIAPDPERGLRRAARRGRLRRTDRRLGAQNAALSLAGSERRERNYGSHSALPPLRPSQPVGRQLLLLVRGGPRRQQRHHSRLRAGGVAGRRRGGRDRRPGLRGSPTGPASSSSSRAPTRGAVPARRTG